MYQVGDEPSELSIYTNLELKMSVVKALDELMRERDIDHVSVSAVCERAGISRATFYRYFQDKFAVVQWFVSYLHSQGANQIGRTLDWYAGYHTSESLVAAHLSFFTNAAKSDDYNSLDKYAPRLRESALTTTVTRIFGANCDDEMRFYIRSTVQTEVHLLPAWHYGQFNCSLEEACSYMVNCVPRKLFELLNTPYSALHPEQSPGGPLFGMGTTLGAMPPRSAPGRLS